MYNEYSCPRIATIIIYAAYDSKKLCAILGKKVRPILPPSAAPQTGAPIPHTCVANMPKIDNIIPNHDFPIFLFKIILSLVFLNIQVMVKAVERIKK